MKAIYYRRAAGSYGMASTSRAGGPRLPKGAAEVTQAEYDAGVAALEKARREGREERAARVEKQTRADFEALVSLGLPKGMALRLSGRVSP